MVPYAVRRLAHIITLEASGAIHHGDVAAALVLAGEAGFALPGSQGVNATPATKQHVR